MKRYILKEQESTNKYQYDKNNKNVILANGSSISDSFIEFNIEEELCLLNGVQYKNLFVYPHQPSWNKKYYIILGYTGDFVRDDNGDECEFDGKREYDLNVLKNTSVITVERYKDGKRNIMIGDGNFLFRDWYDNIYKIGNDDGEQPLFGIEDHRRYNVIKIGSEPIYKEWYSSIKYDKKCKMFICTCTDGYKTAMSKNGEPILNGDKFDNIFGFDVKTFKDNLGGSYFDGRVVAFSKYGEHFKLVGEDNKEITFGDHIIKSITPYQSMTKHIIYELTDQYGKLNILGRKYKTVSDEWFEEINSAPNQKIYEAGLFEGRYKNGNTILMSYLSLESLGHTPLKKYAFIEKNDLNHNDTLCIKRINNSCMIYDLKYSKIGDPVLQYWCNDIGETDFGMLIIENNDKHRIYINSDLKLIPGKGVIEGHACYISITDDGKYIIFSYSPKRNQNLYISKDDFDDVYCVNNTYIIVKKDGKYNYFDTVSFKLVFDRWFEDVDEVEYEDDPTFYVKENGSWKIIKRED